MELAKTEGMELEIIIEELEHKVAPGEIVWPFPGGGGWGR